MSAVKTTKKIDKRVESNTKSLLALRDHLQEIIKNPNNGVRNSV